MGWREDLNSYISDNGPTSAGGSGQTILTNDAVVKTAFDNRKSPTHDCGGGYDVTDLLCDAQTFWAAMKHRLDTEFTTAMMPWLMEPLPWDHPWFNALTEHQKGSMIGKGWSYNRRKAFGYKITRLEYWSVIWCQKSHDESAPSNRCNVRFWETDEQEDARSYNKGEWTAAKKIIYKVWGVYYTQEGAKNEHGGSNTLNLYKKTDGFSDAEIRFVEMLSINQGKGPGFIENFFGYNMVGKDLGDYPWAIIENGTPEWPWIYQGDDGSLANDPMTHGILYRLLYTEGGYNKPFDTSKMGWRELQAFSERIRDSGGELTGQISLASVEAWMVDYNAQTFLEQVLKNLKVPDDDNMAVWDGQLKSDALEVVKKDCNLRDGDLWQDEKVGPSRRAGGAWPWNGRDTSSEDDDWDTGLFYFSDGTDAQIAADSEDMDGTKQPSAMGLPRLLMWLRPQWRQTDHWLGTGTIVDSDGNASSLAYGSQYTEDLNYDSNRQLFKEHNGFLESLATLANYGWMDTYGNNVKFQSGGSVKYKSRLYHLKDSGFTDWEAILKNPIPVNRTTGTGWQESTLSSKGKGKEPAGWMHQNGTAQLLVNEAQAFVPSTLYLGSEEVDCTNFQINFARDINSISPGKVKGDGWDIEPVVESEDATAMIDAVKTAFLDFAGSKENGRGPKERQATSKWFSDNFTNSLTPNETEGLVTELDFSVIADEEARNALKLVLGGGFSVETARMDKVFAPWTVLYHKGADEIPFDQIIRTYQAAAYMAALYYRSARKNVDDVSILVGDIWEHYAHKCAYHIYRIWERLLHDHQVGNYYALIVTILAKSNWQDENVAAALAALAEALKASDDKMMEDIGSKDPPPSVEDPVTEADKKQRERFYKQCSLLLNMDRLEQKYTFTGALHERSVQSGFGQYNGRIHCVTNNGKSVGQKNVILNKLVTPTPETMKSFINIEPAKASSLLPYIRFFRVWNDPDGNIKEIEFDFPKYSQRDISSDNPFDRGDGVGMQEFTIECDGETPATASKYISATLTLHFQTFNDFIIERKNKGNLPFRWVDMFVSPTSMVAKGHPGVDTPHVLRYDSEYYRIRVDVGYHTAQADPLGEAISTQNRSYFLVLKDNEININDDMSVTIKANYGAYIEEAMDSNKFNALSTPKLRQDQDAAKLQWESAVQAYKSNKCLPGDLRKIRNRIEAQLEELIKNQHKSIMTNLLNNERIFFVDFDPQAISDFRQTGVFSKIPEYKQARTVKPGDQPAERLKQLINAKNDPERTPWMEHREPHKDERVYYFYFGDLIYFINSMMYKGLEPWNSKGVFAKEQYMSGAENHKILLMDFDYHNPLAETIHSRRTINISRIPISVDFFFQWYVNNIVKTETYHIGVGNFIKMLLTELITEAMSEICMASEEGHYVSFQHGSISVAGVSHSLPGVKEPVYTDPINSMLHLAKTMQEGQDSVFFDVGEHWGKAQERGETKLALPLKFIPDEEVLKQHNLNGVQGQFQYLYIYGDFKDPYHPGTGDPAKDAARGCYHLGLAQNNGLVKNISFSKNNIPHLRESRMFNQGQAGLLQLSAVYDCEIEMIGNTLFLPGQEVWVNPYGFGGEEFGKPQDPPLNWSPTVDEINDVNDELAKQSEGGWDSEGVKMTAADAALDQLESTVNTRTQQNKLLITSYANVMGIGGYQLILRTKTTIKPGEFTTTINAKHTYTGYPRIKQSLILAEFRNGQPKAITTADEEEKGACRAILAEVENNLDI